MGKEALEKDAVDPVGSSASTVAMLTSHGHRFCFCCPSSLYP